MPVTTGGDDVELLARAEREHRNAVRSQARVPVFSPIHSRWFRGRDLRAGFESGHELVVGGGGVEQRLGSGQDMRRQPTFAPANVAPPL